MLDKWLRPHDVYVLWQAGQPARFGGFEVEARVKKAGGGWKCSGNWPDFLKSKVSRVSDGLLAEEETVLGVLKSMYIWNTPEEYERKQRAEVEARRLAAGPILLLKNGPADVSGSDHGNDHGNHESDAGEESGDHGSDESGTVGDDGDDGDDGDVDADGDAGLALTSGNQEATTGKRAAEMQAYSVPKRLQMVDGHQAGHDASSSGASGGHSNHAVVSALASVNEIVWEKTTEIRENFAGLSVIKEPLPEGTDTKDVQNMRSMQPL